MCWPPQAFRAGTEEVWLRARRYGASPDDLDLPLGGPDRPAAVDAVLAACAADGQGKPLGAARIRAANVAWRMQALLAVAAATAGRALPAIGRCPRCGEGIDLHLDLADFALEPPEGAIPMETGGGGWRLRLPTGEDQARWLRAGAGQGDLAATLLADASGRPWPQGRDLPAGWAAAAETALAGADPLTPLALAFACPHCGGEGALEPDLEGLLLARLERERRSLLRQVHALASAYHWGEAEILALSPDRRAWYVERVGAA